jgi:hypothetical protein
MGVEEEGALLADHAHLWELLEYPSERRDITLSFG